MCQSPVLLGLLLFAASFFPRYSTVCDEDVRDRYVCAQLSVYFKHVVLPHDLVLCGATVCPLHVAAGYASPVSRCDNGGTCLADEFCCSDGACASSLGSCGEEPIE